MDYGLLSDQWSSPQNMGLLGMSSSLLEDSGPSRMPVGIGQALGRGIQAGMAGYQAGQKSRIQQMLAEQEMAQNARLAEAQAAKLEEERQIRAANAATMAAMGIPSAPPSPQVPVGGLLGPDVSPEIGSGFSLLGDYSGKAPSAPQTTSPAPAQFSPQGAAEKDLQLASQFLNAAISTRNLPQIKMGQEWVGKASQALKDMRPTYGTNAQVMKGPDGKLVNVVMGNDGTPKVIPFSPAEKLHFADTNGQIIPLDQYSGAVSGPVLGKTLSPGEVATGTRWATDRQDNMGKMTWREGGDVDYQVDAQGNLTGVTRPRGAAPTAGADMPTLSGAAIENAADRYNLDGTLPPLGLGKAGAEMRRAVLDKAAEKKQGVSGTDQRIAQMGFKADSQSLASMVKASDSIGSFERNLSGAVDLLGPLMEKVNNGKIPAINKLSQIVSYQGGDPNIKAAKNQLITAMMDYQKLVTAGSNVSAAELSVGAQKRAEELLSMADNPETFKNQIAVILQDGKIKADSLKTGISDIRARMGGAGTPSQNSGGWSIRVKP